MGLPASVLINLQAFVMADGQWKTTVGLLIQIQHTNILSAVLSLKANEQKSSNAIKMMNVKLLKIMLRAKIATNEGEQWKCNNAQL